MKLDKKLGIVMIFVVLALVSIGTVAALTIKYPTIKGLSGEAILKILVNTVILAALAYFILPMILGKERTPQSKEGHTAMLVIIILLSIFIAVTIGNRYLWDVSTIKDIADYFIGSEGVLRADRIGIFIGATALFTWFLSFLGVGGNKEKGGVGKINIALAFLIGMHLASEGMSVNTLIGIGQAFALIIFWQNIYKNMDIKLAIKTEGGEFNLWPIISGIIAIIIVGWIGSILSPCSWGWFGIGSESGECAKNQQSLQESFEAVREDGISAFPGLLGSLSNFLLSNWWVLLILIGIILLSTYAAAKEGSFKRMRKDAKKHIFGRLKTAFRKMRGPIGWLLRRKEWRDNSPENEFPFIFRKLRTELQAYMDYMLRWEVYTVKAIVPELAKERINRKLVSPLDIDFYIGIAAQDMAIYKNGPEIVRNHKGFYEVKETVIDWIDNWGWDRKKKTTRIGFNSTKFLLYEMMNKVKHEFENTDLTKVVANEKQEADDLIATFKGKLSGVRVGIEERWESYQKAFDKWGYISLIYSLMDILFGQYLHSGSYEHSWSFANPKAEWFECPVIRRNIDGEDIVTFDKGRATRSGRPVGGLVKGDPTVEVDEKGIFIEDLHNLSGLGSVRFVRDYLDTTTGKWVKGIVDHKRFEDKVSWLNEEWAWFLMDVRDGRFHPFSRTASDYIRAYTEERKFRQKVSRASSPHEGEPAFDREALKDHGKFVYWGRKKYDDKGEESVMRVMNENHFPTISMLGFASYLEGLTKIMEEKQQVVDDYLSLFVYPTGGIKKDILAGTPAKVAEKGGGGS